MLVLWGIKGGSGCSVCAAALGLLSARDRPTLLVDLDGDLPSILGVDAGEGADPTAGPVHQRLGIADWLAAERPPPDALARLEIPVVAGLSLLPAGGDGVDGGVAVGGAAPDRVELLARLLQADDRQVVVDLGRASARPERVLDLASRSVAVTRACYLALRRASTDRRPDHLVLVREPGRALTAADIASSVGRPVGATVAWDPAVARSVDAGTIASRLPRPLRSLRGLLPAR